MKKIIILLLLLLATLAVAWWYWFPFEQPEMMKNYLISTRQSQDDLAGKNILTLTPVSAPELPLAQVHDAEYHNFTDVADSDIYEIIPGTSLDWVRTDNDISYPGEVRIEQGKVAVKGGTVVAGAFVIDMASIRLKGGDPAVLEEIISDTDLDVTQFPQASFILQESLGDTIRGILTIKGVSKEVVFPAVVLVSDTKLRIYTEFSIDRKYRGLGGASPTLSPYINLNLERVLKKK